MKFRPTLPIVVLSDPRTMVQPNLMFKYTLICCHINITNCNVFFQVLRVFISFFYFFPIQSFIYYVMKLDLWLDNFLNTSLPPVSRFKQFNFFSIHGTQYFAATFVNELMFFPSLIPGKIFPTPFSPFPKYFPCKFPLNEHDNL